MSRNEPVHVYQNTSFPSHVSTMHFCPVCNGYYGVPHWGCASRGGCENRAPLCACRRHRELEGKSRQGEFGWIVK